MLERIKRLFRKDEPVVAETDFNGEDLLARLTQVAEDAQLNQPIQPPQQVSDRCPECGDTGLIKAGPMTYRECDCIGERSYWQIQDQVAERIEKLTGCPYYTL